MFPFYAGRFGRASLDAAGGGGVVLALDGNSGAVTGTATQTLPTLTTTNGSGLIVVGVISNGTVSSITGSGLTFTQRGTQLVATGGHVDVFTAPYSTNFSGTITVNCNGSPIAIAFGVSGVKTASPFDVNGPQTNTTTNASITTANANDFVFAVMVTGGSMTAAAPWITIAGSSFAGAMYQIVSATGTYTSAEATGASSGTIIDAIQQGP